MQKTLLLILVAVTAGAAGYWFARDPAQIDLIQAKNPSIESPEKQTPKIQVIPDRLPEFTLNDRDNRPTPISSFTQPILVLNFWATWCEPCRREIPLLRKLRRERGGQGVEIVGIAVDFREPVLKYAEKVGLDYPLLIGEQDAIDAIDALGLPGAFPATVFFDAQRRIVVSKLGELHAEQAAFILDRVAAVNAGQLALPAAKQQINEQLAKLAAERARESPAPPKPASG
jgi:thiol-disulfide isomerase/thioredoxin